MNDHQLLQSYLNRDSAHRDIYHDMMPFKVREILVVSNLYDAFFIEREGRFSEIMLYDYGNMNLTSLPRITGATTHKEIDAQLKSKKVDLVIVMVGIDKNGPLNICKKIKKNHPDLAVFVLLNNNIFVPFYCEKRKEKCFDQLFVWNGESRVFFAMIKYLEDQRNAKTDTQIASVRQILIVEDSPVFYSAYLTHLYQIIFKQTNEIIQEVSTDNVYKVLKLRARPKILLATDYDKAIELFHEYKDFLFCLITDVQYEKGGKMHKNAGFELVEEISKAKKDLPTVVLSYDKSKAAIAKEKGLTFIDKNDPDLYRSLKYSVTQKIGFGSFVFKNREEIQVAKAKTIKDFEKRLRSVPDESIMFHAENDHFSLWLMARAEIKLASQLVEKKAHEFNSPNEIREYILDMINSYRDEKPSGKVVPFSEAACASEEYIVTLADGSFGGKGRGVTFLKSLYYQFGLERQVKGIKIRIPRTAIVGTGEFENFVENNCILMYNESTESYEDVKASFVSMDLSPQLMGRLEKLLKCYRKPLAVRSSGLFEDSMTQPFAGIFETYIVPNNDPDIKVRLKHLADAIKLVYASVFSEKAINYTKALDQKLGQEKMAVLIQELVGNSFDGVYYPHLSGVAQSYNFYPFGHMKPSEGFAVAAIGLGTYVVEGEVAYRFSPKYPKVQFNSLEDQIKFTQTYFYAVDLNKEVKLLDGPMSSLKKVHIFAARDHGSLKHCVSIYDRNNHAIYPGLSRPGPIIVNFASLLNHNYIPLANAIKRILNLIEDAFGTPVEIEFAVDLKLDEEEEATFYILQVKPIIMPVEDYSFSFKKLPKEDTLLFAEKGMGNGVIDYIRDIVFVKNEAFDNTRTEEMAEEVEQINQSLVEAGQQYILIGPGRWGTRDRWIGIPVNWPQISNAKVIVETELEGFPLDASHGSHFFHNLTTLNIAYFSVHHDTGKSFIRYDLLDNAQLIQETTYFKHVRFDKPVVVRIDGKKRIAAILLGAIGNGNGLQP